MRWSVMVALSALGACTGDDAGTGETGVVSSDCGANPIALTLGTGATEHVELATNNPVVLVHGPQGGWHVNLSGLVVHTGQEVSILPSLTVKATSEQIAGDQQPTLMALASYDDAACSGEFFGVRAFVDDAEPSGITYQDYVCSLGGQVLELAITVEDFGTGNTVTTTVDVTANNDAEDTANRCP